MSTCVGLELRWRDELLAAGASRCCSHDEVLGRGWNEDMLLWMSQIHKQV